MNVVYPEMSARTSGPSVVDMRGILWRSGKEAARFAAQRECRWER
jgi:hypothetical protein